MSGALNHILSFMGVTSMICLLVAVILLLHLIQQAFDRSGIVWGMISVLYPPGTYLYCRRNWETLRRRFMLISGLVIISLVLWLILRMT